MAKLTTAASTDYNFLSVRGEYRGPAETFRPVQRPMVDGLEWQLLGKRGEPFRWMTYMDSLNAGNAETLRLAYESLKGSLVTLTTPYSTTLDNVFVLDVVARAIKVGAIAGGLVAGSTYLVEALWTFVDSSSA